MKTKVVGNMLVKENKKYSFDGDEKRKIKDSLIEYWNSFDSGSKAMKSKGTERKLDSLLNDFNEEQLKEGIRKYLVMYIDKEFYFDYKWNFSTYIKTAIIRMLKDKKLKNTYDNWEMKQKNKDSIEKKEPYNLDEYNRMVNTLKYIKYEDYLNTEHWLHFRREALKFYNNECAICGKKYTLEVHHKTYDNRGRETFNDIIVLCDSCHKKVHEIN